MSAFDVSSGLQASWQDDDGDDDVLEPTEPTVSETGALDSKLHAGRGSNFFSTC